MARKTTLTQAPKPAAVATPAPQQPGGTDITTPRGKAVRLFLTADKTGVEVLVGDGDVPRITITTPLLVGAAQKLGWIVTAPKLGVVTLDAPATATPAADGKSAAKWIEAVKNAEAREKDALAKAGLAQVRIRDLEEERDAARKAERETRAWWEESQRQRDRATSERNNALGELEAALENLQSANTTNTKLNAQIDRIAADLGLAEIALKTAEAALIQQARDIGKLRDEERTDLQTSLYGARFTAGAALVLLCLAVLGWAITAGGTGR